MKLLDMGDLIINSQIVFLINLLSNFVLVSVVVILGFYIVRSYSFVFNRIFKRQKRSFQDLAGSYTPSVSILIPMHEEEAVAAQILKSFVDMDYPKEEARFEVIVIDDNSKDATASIIDEYASKYHYITVIHRIETGGNGKPEALNVGLKIAQNEIILIFDADYIPPSDCVKRIVAPFYDAEVGGVMGRVVPINSPESFVTRIMDLERSGGYQLNQQARYNMNLIPQFGGTVGGFRRSVLRTVGEWDEKKLSEDTDITYKVFLHGWKIAYINAAECYEETVSSWNDRKKQLRRWAIGHNQCLFEYFFKTLRSPFLTLQQKLDGILLLGVFVLPLLTLVGWFAGILSYLSGAPWWWSLSPVVFFFFLYNGIGNFAVFTEIGASLFLDKRKHSIRLLPLVMVSIFNNVWVCSKAFFETLLLPKVSFENSKESSSPNPLKIKENKPVITKDIPHISQKNRIKNGGGWDKTNHSGNGKDYLKKLETSTRKKKLRRERVPS
jgi:cellulose synthase/poly-beta-1,6-N-acetylglucosamine synthase-like glycosyltransferase